MLALSPETEDMVRRRAAAKGVTPDEVIRAALGPEYASVAPRIDRAALAALLTQIDALPLCDLRNEKEILDEAWGH